MSHATALALLVLLAPGCPYETAMAPAGPALPLRASFVGTWTCSRPDDEGRDQTWASLRIGWSGDAYLLTLRPPVVDPADADEVPWVVPAKPMRFGGHEVWVLAEERAASRRFYFARLDRSSDRELRFAVLGKGEAGLEKLPETSPNALARALGDVARLGVDQRITCRRPSP
jgi:hypothetical protein